MKNYAKVIAGVILIILSILTAMSVIVANQQYLDSKGPLVCLDAGHGGKDSGAVSKDSLRYEKNDNLTLTLIVKEKLEAKGIRVLLTRSADNEIKLAKRVKKANRRKADIFVSLHRNSAVSGNGVEIWIGSQNDENERRLAQNILDNLVDVGVQSVRGIKVGFRNGKSLDYYINKYSDMTSCLVELVFMTDEKDDELFDKNKDGYAQAVADGIEKALDEKK
ncbi:MAG: N-acetylmuramoyl-L-alanine amidase [Clostridiales bacterium]|nr:N-acetylmuramoyl-L-alanine amidase [Clostridiales bacterium]